MVGRKAMIAAAAAFTLAATAEAGAQTIGFKVGASFAKWNTEAVGGGEADLETLTSFMGGGFIRFGFGRIGFQPELLVVTRGGEYPDEAGEGTGTKIKVDYIEVPVLLVLPLTYGAGFTPYLFGGPSFAFEIGCKIDDELTGAGEQECADTDARKSTDIGATAGLGLSFPMGPGDLLLEGRYNWGLSNISDVEGVEIKSRTGAVLAGYSIWIGSR